MDEEIKTFESELEELINRYSVENESNTPDFILAGYIGACLDAFKNATLKRDEFHGFKSKIFGCSGEIAKD